MDASSSAASDPLAKQRGPDSSAAPADRASTAVQPDARYVVYFSARPRTGSQSDIMLDNALKHGMIDEVHYLS